MKLVKKMKARTPMNLYMQETDENENKEKDLYDKSLYLDPSNITFRLS